MITRWRSSSSPSSSKDAAEYRELKNKSSNPNTRWILLIKELRAEFGIGIFEAQEMAVRDPALRRWVLKQINTEQACRKQALSHIRANGEASLIERIGDSFEFRFRD